MHWLAAVLLDHRNISLIRSRYLPLGFPNSPIVSRSASETGGLASVKLTSPDVETTKMSASFGNPLGRPGNAASSLGCHPFFIDCCINNAIMAQEIHACAEAKR